MLTEIENYVGDNVDRFTVIFSGQPRFVGNVNWKKDTVGLIKETKKKYPNIPIDIICVNWEFDSYNWNLFDIQDEMSQILTSGLPIKEFKYSMQKTPEMAEKFHEIFYVEIDGAISGIIPAKKEKLENDLSEYFSFADTVTFLWFDQFELSREVINYVNKTSNANFGPSVVGWQGQSFIVKYVYETLKDYFDNTLTQNSVIIKTRYDYSSHEYYYNRNNIDLGYYAALLQIGSSSRDFDYNDIINNRVKPGIWDWQSNNIGMNSYPAIVVQHPTDFRIRRGEIYAMDILYAMDKSAFKIYAENYIDFVSEEAYQRFYSSGKLVSAYTDDIHEQEYWTLKTKPEAHNNKFFLQNGFSIIPSGISRHMFGNYELFAYRRMYNEEYDLHRWKYYEWDKQMITELFVPIDDFEYLNKL